MIYKYDSISKYDLLIYKNDYNIIYNIYNRETSYAHSSTFPSKTHVLTTER
jgi:hypothetical protein